MIMKGRKRNKVAKVVDRWNHVRILALRYFSLDSTLTQETHECSQLLAFLQPTKDEGCLDERFSKDQRHH